MSLSTQPRVQTILVGSASVATLTDVDLTGLADDTTIVWSAAAGKFVVGSPSGYILNPATESTLGGVRVDGATIIVGSGGVISAIPYVLEPATESTLGGVRVDGTTVTVSSAGIISAVPSDSYTLPPATTSVLGGVIPDGTVITVDGGGHITVQPANPTALGVVKPDQVTILIDEGSVLSVPLATDSTAGLVMPDGTTITVNSSGVLTAHVSGGGTVPLGTEIHVNWAGDDSTGDGTVTNPYATIAKAVAVIVALGNAGPTNPYVIKLASGTYSENALLAPWVWIVGEGSPGGASPYGGSGGNPKTAPVQISGYLAFDSSWTTNGIRAGLCNLQLQSYAYTNSPAGSQSCTLDLFDVALTNFYFNGVYGWGIEARNAVFMGSPEIHAFVNATSCWFGGGSNFNSMQNGFLLKFVGCRFDSTVTLTQGAATGYQDLTATFVGCIVPSCSIIGPRATAAFDAISFPANETVTLSGGATYTLTTGVQGIVGPSGLDIGFMDIPQNGQNGADYTTTITDRGRHIYHGPADTTPRNWTIDSNANVPYPIGSSIMFVNDTGAGAVTIKITTDTLELLPAGTIGSVLLPTGNVATALKVDTNKWVITGTSGVGSAPA